VKEHEKEVLAINGKKSPAHMKTSSLLGLQKAYSRE
jgi:hypothetical protein